MDALQVIFTPSVFGRFYLVAIYCAAVYVLVRQWASALVILLLLFFLLLFFYFEWQKYFAASTQRPTGLRYQNKRWAVYVAGEWQALQSVRYYYRLPWLIVLRTEAYPSHKCRLLIIWRDSVTAEQWRKLNIYLSV